uniref:NADH dehydrogenase subunit 4L n=1 Tax=Margattea angusta TaxID=1928773 RepID=UPI00279FE08E|nr:NADH dehydrogenase subunit 4L [Margattea angusta]WGO57388.1 NADH dehydrogenase subunit 4L [Margattea angusta]
MLIYVFFMFMCGMWVFCCNRKHLLLTLLGLEFIVLILYFEIYYYLLGMDYELFFGLVFLTFSVCEGALGLSILVSMIRSYGNDYFNTFNILQC